MDRRFVSTLVFAFMGIGTSMAFAPLVMPSSVCLYQQTAKVINFDRVVHDSRRWMGEGSEGESSEEEPSVEITEDEAEEEDPEVVALKEEISQLESILKNKKLTLSYTKDQIEEFSKTGYARKVAEMENMRRVRSSMNSSSRSSATAGVLTDFLPVYDQMTQLKERYADNEFGSKYGGLSMETTFAKMGVKDFTVTPGEPVDASRMIVVESEYSSEFEKDAVIRPISVGLELEGNVLREAECVASLGVEGAENVEKTEGDAGESSEESNDEISA